MIILANPMLSHQTLNADSNYVWLNILITQLLKENPNLTFLLPWPTNPEWKYYSDGFFDDPRIIRIPRRYEKAKRQNNVAYSPGFYWDLFNKFAPDLILNLNVEVGHLLSKFTSCYTNDGEPAIVNQHFFVLHKSTGLPMSVWEHFIYQQIISSLLVDWNLHPSEHCLSMLRENMEIYGLEDLRPKIEEKTEVKPWGIIDVELFKSLLEEEEKFERPTIYYNHRLQGYKGRKVTFDVLEALHKERGGDFDVHISYQAGDWAHSIRRKLPFVRVVKLDRRIDYLRHLAKAHINMTNSTHETFCISLVEAMAMRQAVVAPRGVTFPELLGSWDHPYLFSTLDEQRELLNRLLDNPQEIEKEGERNQRRAFSEYNVEDFAKAYLKIFEKVWELRPFPHKALKPKHRKTFKAYTEKRKTLKVQDLLDWRKVTNLNNQAYPPCRWSRLLRGEGWESYADRQQGAYWMRSK